MRRAQRLFERQPLKVPSGGLSGPTAATAAVPLWVFTQWANGAGPG